MKVIRNEWLFHLLIISLWVFFLLVVSLTDSSWSHYIQPCCSVDSKALGDVQPLCLHFILCLEGIICQLAVSYLGEQGELPPVKSEKLWSTLIFSYTSRRCCEFVLMDWQFHARLQVCLSGP